MTSVSHPNVLVCWSGGCDSTLLLHHTARLYGTPKSPVRALTIRSDQVGSDMREAAARQSLLKRFKKDGLHIEVNEVQIKTLQGNGLHSNGLPQAVLWLLATQALRDGDSLALGYVRGDDYAAEVEAFRSVFDTLQRVSHRTGALWLPLLSTEKRGVLHQLRELKLLDLCWWCEMRLGPKKKLPCGECASCETHEMGVLKLERFGPGFFWEGEE